MTDGKEGRIVPTRDVDASAEGILWRYQHPEETRTMGKTARARIVSEFTLDLQPARYGLVPRPV